MPPARTDQITTVRDLRQALRSKVKNLPLKLDCQLLKILYEAQLMNPDSDPETRELLNLIYIKQRQFSPGSNIDDALKKFRRERAMGLHTNPFIVPVWASAECDDEGYLVYPRLKRLTNCLPKLTEEEILRCLLHIALALDFLHTTVPGKRAAIYHRMVCVENVFLDDRNNARLGGLRFATETHGRNHEESEPWRDQQLHQHPSLLDFRALYTRQCDWYSFSMMAMRVIHQFDERNIRSVIDLLKKNKENRGCILEEIQKYNRKAEFQDSGNYEFIMALMKPLFLWDPQLGDEDNRSYEGKQPLNEGKCPHLEYKLSPVTTELRNRLARYGLTQEDIYKKGTNKLSVVGERCISCLLREIGPLNTNKNRWSVGCGKCCIHYCNGCYSNREPLYCPEHFTATTIIGHNTAYALILFGDHEENNPDEKEIFKSDATKVKNCLTHFHINGINDENMVFEALYSNDKCPVQLLKDACNKLCEKINCKEGEKQLILFYSGHGKDLDEYKDDKREDEDEGRFAWNPQPKKENTYITLDCVKKTIRDLLLKLCELKQYVAVLDHCYPIPLFTNTKTRGVTVSGEMCKKVLHSCTMPSCNGSCITHLFCQFLRSGWGTSQCKSDCDWCRDTVDIVEDKNCLTYRALEHAMSHVETHHADFCCSENCTKSHSVTFTPKLSTVPRDQRSEIFLGFYNPGGVRFMLKELDSRGVEQGEIEYEYPFNKEITLECIKTYIQEKLKAEGRENIAIVLLSDASEYYRYTLPIEDELKMALEHCGKQLYYRVVKDTDKCWVRLEQRDTGNRIDLEIPCDMDMLVFEYEQEMIVTNLPNVLVWVLHFLRIAHKTGKCREQSTATLQEPANLDEECICLHFRNLLLPPERVLKETDIPVSVESQTSMHISEQNRIDSEKMRWKEARTLAQQLLKVKRNLVEGGIRVTKDDKAKIPYKISFD